MLLKKFKPFTLKESKKILTEIERNEKADVSTSQMPSEGDLVVHLTHGIGKFVGLKQLKTFVGVSDCLEIEYQEKSKGGQGGFYR